MPDLKRYRARRDPERSPEPVGAEPGGRALAPGSPGVFVVQQHAARSMHWDLRLEIDGVLASWAVPKGPSDDPGQKRFAARTEDHPMEYAEFEAIIPEGNYGAGAMIVWDQGTYRTVDGTRPADGLAAGKLDLLLRGHKLDGRFALVRMKGEEGRSWLLLSKGPARDAGEEITRRLPRSVLSGLTVEQLRDGHSPAPELLRELDSLDAPGGTPSIRELRPMLASTGSEPFADPAWLFELKYDGARVLARRRGDEVQLRARSGRDATQTYPEIARALARLPVDDALLDGEVVALDARGRSSFELLQRRFRGAAGRPRAEIETPVVYYAFDLIGLLGRDLRGLPLVERKRLLARLLPGTGRIRRVDHIEGDGRALFAAAREHGLEGVIAKRALSRWTAGERSADWLKLKVERRADLVIAGWQPRRGSRRVIGSLVLGWWRDGELVHAGNVGSGLSDTDLDELRDRLDALEQDACPLAAPVPPARGTIWVRPEQVCEVRYNEVTAAGLLRQPVFARLRDDRDAAGCEARSGRDTGQVAPRAAPRPRESELELTHLDKLFWPAEGYTKRDLIAYHEAIWPWLAPYLRDRPVVLTRYPDGIDGKSFYQKNAPEFTPAWVERETIDGTDYFICNELRTLLYVINSGAIPLHVWHARRDRLDRPDWVVLDLDPKRAPFAHVVRVARQLHRLLEELGAPHFVKTSGQDGLHVLLPLDGSLDHDQARILAELLARVVVEALPEIATIARPLAARGEKVYVDYLQNGRGKLIAAPFCVRPRPGAPVSTPLRWTQVTSRLDPTRWNVRTTPRAMRRSGDPMADLLDAAVDVPALLEALSARL